MRRPSPARALTVAGSDSGGGAGIQADLKTFSAMQVYGASAVTAVTAQNTQGVAAVHAVPADVVAAQIDAVLDDIGADAVKTGMLLRRETVEVVSERLSFHSVDRLVVDPVMIAKGGHKLLEEDAVGALKEKLLPLALVVTPNRPEAEVLSGVAIGSDADALVAARRILELGPRSVIVKGGHSRGDACDLLLAEDGREIVLCSERIRTGAGHGTGCTFAAALTAALALGMGIVESFDRAKHFVTRALGSAPSIGEGHGPVDHMWPMKE